MYMPTNARPAAMPTAASWQRPALYHYAPAPYTPRRYGQGRSMAAQLAAKGYSPALARHYIARQAARLAKGLPARWPA